MLRNITLSADGLLIQKAREKAVREHRSLNTVFRNWLSGYVTVGKAAGEYDVLMRRLSYARPGRKFNRDEMNER
jgi:hypothetical protein